LQSPRHPHHPRLLPLALLLASLTAPAQTTPTPAQQPTQPSATPPATPHGEVLFQSHGTPPTTPDDDTPPAPPAMPAQTPNGPVLSDDQRSAILFTAYDLDARLAPATSHLAMRARLTLRNIGAEPLARIALQISSTLHWETASLIAPTAVTPLTLTQHLIETDADHTGQDSEAVIDLPTPLAPGATLTLDTVYSGTLPPSAARLERLGASESQALETDWDALGTAPPDSSSSSSSSDSTPPAPSSPTLLVALRGFGNILWYPVAAPQLFLGDGAKLFQAVGQQRLANRSATIHLRLAVEYHSAPPPTAAYFNSRRQPLTALSDDPNAPTATASGIATADFPTQPLGARQPNLFVVQQPEVAAAPLPEVVSTSSDTPTTPGDPSSPMVSSSAKVGGEAAGAPHLASEMWADKNILSVETTNTDALSTLTASAERIAPLLQTWFGSTPLTPLTILDHPGDPFEDNALLVAPIDKLSSTTSSPALAHSLTHAWVQTGQPWFDEGFAQFTSLLWIEQTEGRSSAILALNNLIQPLNIAEVGFDTQQEADAPTAPTGQPLISATSELYYRRKAAAVWAMLRGIAGDKPLQQALAESRTQPSSSDDPTVQATAFEKLLEKTSGKDLGWFFSDWVLRDRGLADLSISDVEPRQIPAGKGHDAGWLVAVTVHNDAAPAVDVPLTILSGAFTTTSRIHIPGFSDATTRVIVTSAPTQIILNDGSTPEVRASTHTRDIAPQPTTPTP
jgi:hypothetical protein